MITPLRLFTVIFTLLYPCAGIAFASDPSGMAPESRKLTVQEAVQMTLSRSPDVLLAEARTIRAAEALRESRSLKKPQLVTGTGLAYNNGYPLSMEGAAPSIFQIGASQSIFSKRNNNLIREAEESGKASRLGTESIRNEMASKTALVYCELYKARKLGMLASARLDAARREQERLEILLAAGKVRPVDVTLARAGTYSAQQQLLVAREDAGVAEAELQSLTGLEETVSIDPAEPRIESPVFESSAEALYQQALERSPEILQAESSIRAKEFRLEAERGGRLPQMDIIGQYALFSKANNYDDFFTRFTRNNFLIGLSLQVPIFDGSRVSARVAQSRQEISEARYRLQRLQSDLKMNIQRGLSALRIARGAFDLALQDLEASREMVRVSETMMEAGRMEFREMEESRIQMQQREQALLEADLSVIERKLELLRAIGSVDSALR